MKKLAFAAALLLISSATFAGSVTASIVDGTSYVHLGRFNAGDCRDLMSSPVIVSRGDLKVAVDGHAGEPNAALCHDGVRVDLVTDQPVVTTTAAGITTWPMSRERCAAVAKGLLDKGRDLKVNDKPVSDAVGIERACSKSNNAVTVALDSK